MVRRNMLLSLLTLVLSVFLSSCTNNTDGSSVHVDGPNQSIVVDQDYLTFTVKQISSLEYQFVPESSLKNDIGYSYNWFFSEKNAETGTTSMIGVSAEKVTSQNFNSTGSYIVKLQVYGVDGKLWKQDERTVEITGYNGGTSAQLNIDVSKTTDLNTLKFKPTISGARIDGVTYKWDFGDYSSIQESTSNSPEVYHTFAGKGPYEVQVEANADMLDMPIVKTISVTTGSNVIFERDNITEMSDNKLSYKYSVSVVNNDLSVSEMKFKWNLADNTTQVKTGVKSGSTYTSELEYKYSRYYEDFSVTVEAGVEVGGEFVVLGSKTLEKEFVTPTYDYTSSSITGSKTIQFNVAGAYYMDGAKYRWNFGDGSEPVETTDTSISYTYSNFGSYNVTLYVSNADKAPFFSEQIKTKPINVLQDVNGITILCNNDGASKKYLGYVCEANLGSIVDNAEYTWKIDDKIIQKTTTPRFEYEFPVYNQYYTVSVDVVSSEITQNVTASTMFKTPSLEAEIQGKSNLIGGESSTYSVIYKVRMDDGVTDDVFLDNAPTLTWTYNNVQTTGDTYTNTFSIDDALDSSLVTLKVSVATNKMYSTISASKLITIQRATNSVSDIQMLTLTCNPASSYNVVKQLCRVNVGFSAGLNPRPDDFEAVIYDNYNVVEHVVPINKDTEIILDWPTNNVTGKNSSRNYTVSAKVYNKSDKNNILSSSTLVTVKNPVNYSLFALPARYVYGGSGAYFGTYSCGYADKGASIETGIDNSRLAYGCNVSNSKTGQTFTAGNLVDSNGAFVDNFRFEWGYNINYADGTVKSGIIKTFDVTKGTTISSLASSKNLEFSIKEVFEQQGIKYTGDVYNNDVNNDIFYLKITGNGLSKPLKVTYNGNSISHASKLRTLSPLIKAGESSHACALTSVIEGHGAMQFDVGKVNLTLEDNGYYDYRKLIPIDSTNTPRIEYRVIWYGGITPFYYSKVSNYGLDKNGKELNYISDLVYSHHNIEGNDGFKRIEARVIIKNMLKGSSTADEGYLRDVYNQVVCTGY